MNVIFDKKIIVNELWIVLDRNIEYGICSLFCFNDEDVWMCSKDNILWFYKLKGELVREIYIKFGNKFYDIVVIKKWGFNLYW